jgi:hypothetical protein
LGLICHALGTSQPRSLSAPPACALGVGVAVAVVVVVVADAAGGGAGSLGLEHAQTAQSRIAFRIRYTDVALLEAVA